MSRLFDGLDDVIYTAVPAGGNVGTGTFVAIVKIDSFGATRSLMRFMTAGFSGVLGMFADAAGKLGMSNAAAAPVGATSIVPGEWYLLGIGKDSGFASARVHLFRYSTGVWIHENTTAMSDASLPGTDGLIAHAARVGDQYTPCTLAIDGFWTSNLSDAAVEGLISNSLAWLALSPTGLWTYEQASVADPVVDWSGNGGHQVAIVGTTVSTDEPPGWTYGAASSSDMPSLVGAGAAVATNTSGAALTPPLPPGWQADDVVFMLHHLSANTTINAASMTGWTQVSAGNNTGAQRVEVWARRMVAGDAAPAPTTTSGTTGARIAQCIGIRGVDPALSLASLQISRSDNAASATVTFATLTPTPATTRLLALYAYEDDPTAASTITNWGPFTVSTTALGTDAAIGYASRDWPSASTATGALTTTVSGGSFSNSPNVGILIDLPPSSGVTNSSRTVTGDQPAASGTLARSKSAQRTASGSQPAASGTLTRLSATARTPSSTQPSPSGSLARILATARTPVGTQPGATGTLTRGQSLTRSLAGAQPASTGAISDISNASRSIAGAQSAATGTLGRLAAWLRALSGDQPPAAGILSSLAARFRTLDGSQPAAIGMMTRIVSVVRTFVGDQPAPAGTLANDGATGQKPTTVNGKDFPPFSDNFDNGSVGNGWQIGTLGQTQDTNVTVLEQNGRLEITPLDSQSGPHFNGLVTVNTYDLTDKGIAVRVTQTAGASSNNVDHLLEFGPSGLNVAAFLKEGSNIYAYRIVDGVGGVVATTAYSSVDHLWWGVYHDVSDDTIKWVYSSDGSTWTQLASTARWTGLDVAASYLALVGGDASSETITPDTMYFEDFNGGASAGMLPDTEDDGVPTVGAQDEIGQAYTRSVSGNQPAAIGTLAHLLVRIRSLSGSQPSSSGVLVRIRATTRSLDGSQSNATGALSRLTGLRTRNLTGSQPTATGVVLRGIAAIRTVTGAAPSASGSLVRLFVRLRSLAGSQPTATGTLTPLKGRFRTSVGVQPSATGVLTRMVASLRLLAGAQVSASGVVTRLASRHRTFTGAQPSPTGVMTTKAGRNRAVTGVQLASTGVLSSLLVRLRALSGVQAAPGGTLAREPIARLRALTGAQESATGHMTRSISVTRLLEGLQFNSFGELHRAPSNARIVVGFQDGASGTIARIVQRAALLIGFQPAAAGILTAQTTIQPRTATMEITLYGEVTMEIVALPMPELVVTEHGSASLVMVE